MPKKWFGRVAMRELAKALDRLEETVEVFEIRAAIREARHGRSQRGRPPLKAIRERRAAEAAWTSAQQARIARRKRDARGRFLPGP